MARVSVMVLFTFALLFVAALAQAQPGKPTDGPARPSNRPTGTAASNETEHGKGKPAREAGRLTVEGGEALGNYVRFIMDLDACQITHFQVYEAEFLAMIQLPGNDCRMQRGGAPGSLEVVGNRSELRVHDAPTGLLQFRSRDGPVEVIIAPDVDFEMEENASTMRKGNLTAKLFALDDVSTSSASTFSADAGTFMVHPASGTSDERRKVFEAIQRGKVGAQADVLLDGGKVVSETFVFDDVELRMRQGGKERFDFTVSANLSGGRVFIVNFDPGAWDPDRLRVDYNDVEGGGELRPTAIRSAPDLESVLSASGPDARYFAFEDQEGWHAAVYVPSFSVHVFQVVGLPLQVVPLMLYAFVIVGLVFGAGGVGVMLERRARAR